MLPIPLLIPVAALLYEMGATLTSPPKIGKAINFVNDGKKLLNAVMTSEQEKIGLKPEDKLEYETVISSGDLPEELQEYVGTHLFTDEEKRLVISLLQDEERDIQRLRKVLNKLMKYSYERKIRMEYGTSK